LDDLFSIAYEELRRLAATLKRGDESATLNPTALVNEAWLRLRGSAGFEAESRLHFKRIAARAMRQILVEAARRRHAQKRGGDGFALLVGWMKRATSHLRNVPFADDVLALEEALNELENWMRARLNWWRRASSPGWM
jgi:RNA polymerase sigma-70 factor, ECF subfamily